MALATSNIYGRITISDDAVAVIAGHAASECYGVSELVSNRFSDILSDLFNRRKYGKGIRVVTIDNRIFLSVYVTVMHGIKAEAVKESLQKAVAYSVESFTGMRVKAVDVYVVGYKV